MMAVSIEQQMFSEVTMTEKNGVFVCACCVCRKDILEGQDIVDNEVYKCGELHYIELAHKNCAPEMAQMFWLPKVASLTTK